MRWLRAALCSLVFWAASAAQAWSGHTLCSWQALAPLTELQGVQAPAETLEQFVSATAPRLEVLLREHETWARQNLADYPARPDELAFKAAAAGMAVPRFLQALRLNGDSRLKLFVQLRPGQARADQLRMPWVDISALRSGSAARENTFVQLEPGDTVAALDVLATASSEPDYGLDIGLFTDNGTAQGARYGFGKQPYGSPAVDYSSQAPFHMGFFHEAGIVNLVAPFIRRGHPESRIALFSALAREAFASGHAYWGWRFTGWALHYVQDLTQPYHARALPGVGAARMLWIYALAMAGRPGARDDAITLVTNRHIVLEGYQFARMSRAYERGDLNDALLAALRDASLDRGHWLYAGSDARTRVSAEAAANADTLDAQLARSFPARLVADAAQPLGNDASSIDMQAAAREMPATEQAAFERELITLMQRLGQHTRALVRAVLAPR